MTIEKLERVMWRLRVRNGSAKIVYNNELARCIMLEIGTDPRTLRLNRNALIKLQWLKSSGRKCVELTGKDILES